ncbi:MAG TPA: cytochrome P450 [Gammaproteobacteria bacterium]|nr:cytochrome P450 [Gammaproteobacteria bacterium]
MSQVRKDPVATAREEAWAMPLEEIDVSREDRFQNDTFWPFFERLRREDPVHYCRESYYGPYWSVTRFRDIMQVETHPGIFSSEPAITIADPAEDFPLPMFIAMDPPKHDEQRKVVSPVVAPSNLAKLEGTIRERVQNMLDNLPRNETFDWVDRVSIELTSQTLATLLDFPFAERRKLTRWSDIATSDPERGTGRGLVNTQEERRAELLECLEAFVELWNERVNAEPGNDLVSMLAHGESTRNMDRTEYLGNLILLIVGGNDTTRNSISGGVVALNKYPEQYRKLREDRSLIKSMVPEIIRWQTPLAHMRRIAMEDTELHGRTIRKGDKVVMWYVSGNRDEDEIERADDFIIDRPNPRHHLSFGYGIHRCMGNRVGELQLRILWEEIMQRFDTIEVMEEPERVPSSFVHGYSKLMVRIPT